MNLSRDSVAAEVRAAMGRAGINQTQLCRHLTTLKGPGLSERLSGKRPFTTDQLEDIARALDVDPMTFLLAAAS